MADNKISNSDYPDLSGNQFKQLVNLAKLISGLVILGITIITSVAIFFSYSSISDIKEEVKSTTDEMKSDVKRFLQYSQNEVDRITKFSEKQVNYIKEDAIYNAQKSAEKEVEQFFKNDVVIESLVNNSAEQVLSNFENEVSDLTQALPDILLAIDNIRNGSKIGLEKIAYLAENSKNDLIKEISSRIFEEKKNDYYRIYNNKNGSLWGTKGIDTFLVKIEKDPSSYLAFAEFSNSGNIHLVNAANSELWSDKNKTELIKRLIHNVNTSKDLNVIALSFFIVKEMTDINCELFDFNTFYDLSKSYSIKKEYLE